MVQWVGVLTTFHESSPRSKPLQALQSTMWWTNTCPWNGFTTTLRLHSSTMLGACLLQSHGAIYSQSRALGSWRSDDTVTTTLLPCLATSLLLVHQWCLSPATESHGYSNPHDSWVVENLRPFDWRPSGIGVPQCSARSVWAPGDQKHHGDQKLHFYDFVGPPWSVCLLLRSPIP
jgi:hypothetical protein